MQANKDGTKYCPGCKQTLPISEFGISRREKDGLNTYCRGCANKLVSQSRLQNSREIIKGKQQCITCKEWKDLSEFNKCKSYGNGYDIRCKQCAKKHSTQTALQNSRPIVDRKQQCNSCKQWKDLSEFSKNKARGNGYKPNCKQCASEANIKTYKKHPETRKNWIRKNPERVRRNSRKTNLVYRTKKAGNGGSYNEDNLVEVTHRYGDKCLECGKPSTEVKLVFEHVLPISKGGMTTIENYQSFCASCNSKKRSKVIDRRPKNWRVLIADILEDEIRRGNLEKNVTKVI